MPVLSVRGAAAARGFGWMGLRNIVITQTFTSSTNWTAPLTTTSITTLIGRGSDGGGYYTPEVPASPSAWFMGGGPYTQSLTVNNAHKPYNWAVSGVDPDTMAQTGGYIDIHPSNKSGSLCLKDCGGGGVQMYRGAGHNGDYFNPTYHPSRFFGDEIVDDMTNRDDSRFQSTCPMTFQTMHDYFQGVINSLNSASNGTTISWNKYTYYTRSAIAYQAGYWTYYSGSNTTGLGYTFNGGASNSAASSVTYNNVAVTPGATYSLSIPSGGSIQMTYTYKG
jgi:hypothetical protein